MTTSTTPSKAPLPHPRDAVLDRLHLEIRGCEACRRAGHLSEVRPLVGEDARPGARLMVIGQAPSKAAIREVRPFAGVGGRRLVEWMRWAGLDEPTFRRETYMTAMTKCFPGAHPKGRGDRRPSAAELALCRPFLDRQIDAVDPGVIVLVGGLAIESLLGRTTLDAVVGDFIERNGRRWLPLPHPSGVSTWLNEPANVARVRRATTSLREWLVENLPELPLLAESEATQPAIPAGGGRRERR